MKKLLQLIPATMVSVAFVGGVAGAQALPDCSEIVITNTGPASYNQGKCDVVAQVHVDCDNNFYVLNDNDQKAVTGLAKVVGNVTAGTAITGNALNTNNETVKIGASCAPAVSTHSTGSVGGGAGGGAGSLAPTQPTGGKGSMNLPFTESNSMLVPLAMASVAATASVALLSRAGSTLYRRFGAK